MKKYLFFLLVLIPLLISGCFGFGDNSDQDQVKEVEYELYRNESIGEANFKVKYAKEWRLEEISNGLFGTSTDELLFKVGLNHRISLKVLKDIQAEALFEPYTYEEITQTEVSRFIGKRIVGYKENEEKKEEVIAVSNGLYIYLLSTNKPDSPEFIEFLNNITIDNNLNEVEVTPDKSIFKLYFARNGQENCQASYYREIYLNPEAEEFALIPKIVMAILRPGELALENLELFTSIPLGTKLLSYGYDNNKVIVNFDLTLNEGGGSCMMELRRSQIEKTLFSLNENTDLDIREVEIWVNNSPDEVLQP